MIGVIATIPRNLFWTFDGYAIIQANRLINSNIPVHCATTISENSGKMIWLSCKVDLSPRVSSIENNIDAVDCWLKSGTDASKFFERK